MMTAGVCEPTGAQRVRFIAKRLRLNPEVVTNRLRVARCVLCDGALSYIRRYMEKQHSCAKCTPAIPADARAALDTIQAYV